MARIFVDASALVPMTVTRDQWRPRLEHLMKGLRQAGKPQFVTSNWTLYEALAIAHRTSPRLARSLHSYARGQMNVVRITSTVEEESLRRFLAWDDQDASIVDHANLLSAEQARCEAVLSFDDDFRPLVEGSGLRLLR